MARYRLVDIHTNKPTIEQVVFDVLDQLALGADREQSLDQAGPEQAFGRNRRPATTRVQRLKLGTHALQDSIGQDAQLAQRIGFKNAFFERSVAEHGVLGNVCLAHGFEVESCSHHTTFTAAAQLTGRWDFSIAC